MVIKQGGGTNLVSQFSSAQLCPALCNPMDCSTPGFTVHHQLPEFAQTHVGLPLLILPLIFPSIRVFSNESVLHIRWPNYWSFSFSNSPSIEYSALVSLGLTGLMTNVPLVKVMVFPIFMYRCERWAIKKAEHGRIAAFELWCWRRLLRVPWTARRSSQSTLKKINHIHWKD